MCVCVCVCVETETVNTGVISEIFLEKEKNFQECKLCIVCNWFLATKKKIMSSQKYLLYDD